MAIPATQIRRGMVIVFEGQPCKVVEFRHHTPGNLRAMVQTKLRNIRTGASFEHRFRSADTVDRANLEQHEMEYLYSEGSPIGIDLPPSMELIVMQTEPTLKSATVSNVNKPATLENGVTITVPPFINEGDRIRVDPTEGRYIERAK